MRRTGMVAAIAAAVLVVTAGCATEVAGSGHGQAGPQQPAPVPVSGATTHDRAAGTGGSPRSSPQVTPGTTTAEVEGGPSATRPSVSQDAPTASPDTSTSITPAPASPDTTTEGTQSAGGTIHEIKATTTEADPADFPGKVTEVGFESPSGNIWCGFSDFGGQTATCQIQQFDYTPEPANDCHGGGHWGTTLRLVLGHPAEFRCAGDLEGGGPTLRYGKRLTVGDLTCASQETGVTCWDSTGAGFWVSRADYRFF